MSLKPNPGPAAQRVLVIKLSAIGDFMLALGAARTVRRHHPNAEITLLTTPLFQAFAEACPYFDRVWTDGRPKTLGATLSMLRRLRKTDFDIVYDFQTSGRSANYFLAFWPKPPLWSGISLGCTYPHTNPARAGMHSIDRLGEQLEQAGVPRGDGEWPPTPDFSWVLTSRGDRDDMQPAHFGLKGRYALLIPGASSTRSAKRWPEENYVALAQHLGRLQITPVVIGGQSEEVIARIIQDGEPKAVNLIGKTDFFQIVALGANATIAIGNDTGPMHLSTLSGAPGVALFATTMSNPDQASPRGAPVMVVFAPTLDQVSVEKVTQATDALLADTAR